MAVQMRLSALNTVLQENVAGLKVVRAFAREPEEQAPLRRAADALCCAATDGGPDVLVPVPGDVPDRQPRPGGGAVLRRAADHPGTLSLGEWQKFSLYLAYVFLPMGQLGFIINLMSQASASAQRIFEILDTTNEIAGQARRHRAGRSRRPRRVRQRHVPLLQGRRSRAQRRLVSRSKPARRWRCSAPPAAARRRSSICCRASTTRPKGGCWSTATTSAT